MSIPFNQRTVPRPDANPPTPTSTPNTTETEKNTNQAALNRSILGVSQSVSQSVSQPVSPIIMVINISTKTEKNKTETQKKTDHPSKSKSNSNIININNTATPRRSFCHRRRTPNHAGILVHDMNPTATAILLNQPTSQPSISPLNKKVPSHHPRFQPPHSPSSPTGSPGMQPPPQYAPPAGRVFIISTQPTHKPTNQPAQLHPGPVLLFQKS